MNRQEAKTTLVIGASMNPERYSNMAMRLLKSHGHPVLALGLRKGEVAGIPIETESKCFEFSQIDTITLYINPLRQSSYIQTILDLNPKRVIFNPGTENETLMSYLDEKGIAWEESCTLVLLRTGQY